MATDAWPDRRSSGGDSIRVGAIGLNIGEDGLSDEETSASDSDSPIPFGRANADGHLSASRPAAMRWRPAPADADADSDSESGSFRKAVSTSSEDAELAAERLRQERMAARVASFVKAAQCGEQSCTGAGATADACLDSPDPSNYGFREERDLGHSATPAGGAGGPLAPDAWSRTLADRGLEGAYPTLPSGAAPPSPPFPLHNGEETKLLGEGEAAPGRFSLMRLLPPWLQQQRSNETAQ